MYPASSIQVVRLIVTQFQASINSLKESGVEINPQIEESMENLQLLMRHLQERSKEGTLRSDKDPYALLHNMGAYPGKIHFWSYQFSTTHHFPKGPILFLFNSCAEDQQNFRTIPIYPTSEEFHMDQRPFLRPNLTSQRYTNTHIYLDTHFRLLREDFVRPLRDGIQQILSNHTGGQDQLLRTKRFDDIRVYFDTCVVFPTCTNTGIAHTLQFDTQPLKVNIKMDFTSWFIFNFCLKSTKKFIKISFFCSSCFGRTQRG